MATAPTSVAPGSAPAQQKSRWGQKGISEKFYVQDTNITEQTNAQMLPLADAGIVSELQHHHSGTYTMTLNGGTITKDPFGPYSAIQQYTLKAGSNTPLVSLSGRAIGLLQIMEYPGKSFEANDVPASVENALTNISDVFNYPSVTGTMRLWFRIPVALKLMGAPGGNVAYMVLQNKRISNNINVLFGLSGASSPYTASQSSGSGAAPYSITGGATVTAAPILETWKTLHTVPASRNDMPLFGFTRYINENFQAYSGSSFTYNFEPGGELLRACFQFLDATAGAGSTPAGMATANLSSIAYQYGTNKQMDVYTPYRNIQEQLLTYGRVLPQGCFVFDYYTQSRNLVNTKSTENTANVQVVAQLASTYVVPANSQVSILTDKVYAVQNYLGK